MDTTKNIGLKKPAQEDFYSVEDFNENADVIDEEIGDLKTALTSAIILKTIYPVNSIVEFGADVDPNKDVLEWKGIDWKWERYAPGMTTVGYKAGDSLFGTIGAEVGSKNSVVVNHTHPQAAHEHTVGNQSANHTHSQVAHTHTVGNQSANHTHALNGSGAQAASVSLTGGFNCVAYYSHTAEGIIKRTFTSNTANIPSGSGYGGAWFDVNATHNHALSGSTGGNSANHNHAVSGGATTTGSNSASHSHKVSGGATTTGAASDGIVGTDKNVQPSKVTAKWIRTE